MSPDRPGPVGGPDPRPPRQEGRPGSGTRPLRHRGRRASRSGSRRPLAGSLALAVLLVAAGGLSGCSKDDGSSSTTSTTRAPATTIDPLRDPDGAFGGSHGSVPDSWCDSKPPGIPVPAAEAIVKFDRQQVCPGYVTVALGTEVTWRNLDSIPHVVTITTSVSSDEVVDQATVAAGGEWKRPFGEAGAFGYRTDAIPSMRGTVEVQGPDGAAGHAG